MKQPDGGQRGKSQHEDDRRDSRMVKEDVEMVKEGMERWRDGNG